MQEYFFARYKNTQKPILHAPVQTTRRGKNVVVPGEAGSRILLIHYTISPLGENGSGVRWIGGRNTGKMDLPGPLSSPISLECNEGEDLKLDVVGDPVGGHVTYLLV